MHRVTRIHNRFLRNRFDAAMENVARKRNIRVASADSGGKRNLEYLFFDTTFLHTDFYWLISIFNPSNRDQILSKNLIKKQNQKNGI